MLELPTIDSLPHKLAADARLVGTIRSTELPTGTFSESVYIPFAQFGAPLLGISKYFPANPRLDGDCAEILALECVDVNTNTNFPTETFPTDTLPVTGAPGLNNYVFVAATQTNQVIFTVPLTSMIRNLQRGMYCMVRLNSQLWENCYIQRVSGTANVINGVWINVFYRKIEKW